MTHDELAYEIGLLNLDCETPEQKRIKKKKDNKVTKYTTEEFKQMCSERMKRLWNDPVWRERQLVHLRSMEHTGHPHSPEARKKMSEAWTEERRKRQSETLRKSLSRPEVQEKLSNRVKGKHWWHKGTVNTFSFECPGDGWERGRS